MNDSAATPNGQIILNSKAAAHLKETYIFLLLKKRPSLKWLSVNHFLDDLISLYSAGPAGRTAL